MKRVGILGGTFSPPHIGHLAMAKTVFVSLKLDEIIFIPCGDPPHKELVWNSALRLEMTKMLVKKDEKFSVSDIEITGKGKSYTAKTLKHLKKQNPDTLFFFIVGADSLCYMDDWMTPEIIFENAEIVVLDREGYTDKRIEDYILFLSNKYNAKIHRVNMPRVDVSSSRLRKMLENNEDISEYTGKEIYEMILRNKDGYIADC